MARRTAGVAVLHFALLAASTTTAEQENLTALFSENASATVPKIGVVHTAAHKVGVATNQVGDLAALKSNLLVNCLIWFSCMLAFSLLRLKFPMVYSNNVLRNDVPSRLAPSKRPWGWMVASLQMQTSEVFERRGLDAAMFLEFTQLSMRVLGTIGVPLMIVVTPVYSAFKRHSSEDKHVWRIEMGPLQEEYTWLHYLVACLVWLVVLVTRKSVFNAQARFLKLRFQWLRGLPRPWATTVLIEKIPKECQEDTKLHEYFEEMFGPGSVQFATVVKGNSALLDLTTRWEVVWNKLHAAKMKLEKEGMMPRKRIKSLGPDLGQSVAAIPHYEEELRFLAPAIHRAQKSLRKAAKNGCGGAINTSNGFVTFTRRREAEMAQELHYTANRDEWAVSAAPDPQSVRWKDLRHSHETMLRLRELLGYCCIVGLMLGCLVIVSTITNCARLIDLSDMGMPSAQPLWEAFAPTLAFQLFVSFLPSVLVLIFRTFFVLKDDSWAQHKLQIWYFWILVVYVILVACIGRSLTYRLRQVMESPVSIAHVLAEALPDTTHFYMNYMFLQWATHATNFLRYMNLGKYFLLSAVYPDEEARRMSEPEDQDYYGIGSRSARFTINMLIGIVFSTISPVISLLAFVNFALCRLQYGYLIMFAETRKPDLGGVFWVSQLEHVQFGVMIYCCLMIGMLHRHSVGDVGPTIIASVALVFTMWSYRRFHQLFEWVRLPLNQINPDDEDQKVEAWKSEAYLQPELQDNPELAYYSMRSGEIQEDKDIDASSIVHGIVRVLSSGAEVVGELMKEVGSTIDQTFLGADSEASRTGSSPPRAAHPPKTASKQSPEVEAEERSSGESTPEAIAALTPKESMQEGVESRAALRPRQPRMPLPPRAPSPPRSFPDDDDSFRAGVEWWLGHEATSRESSVRGEWKEEVLPWERLTPTTASASSSDSV